MAIALRVSEWGSDVAPRSAGWRPDRASVVHGICADVSLGWMDGLRDGVCSAWTVTSGRPRLRSSPVPGARATGTDMEGFVERGEEEGAAEVK